MEKEKSWDQVRKEFSEMLEMDGLVPENVLKRAIADEKFASYLISMKGKPNYLDMMFKDPKNKAYDDQPAAKQNLTNLGLVKKAAGAMLNWAKSGFKTVDAATFEKRFSTCKGCEHFAEAPDLAMYKVTIVKDLDSRICSLCGCVASRKAKLASENCPAQDAANPSLSKWQEPIAG